MTASSASRYFAPLALGAGLLALPLCAAANSITFTNTGNATASPAVPPLSIQLSSDILVNSQGNFSTTCQKAAPSDPYCSGIQTGPSGDEPVLSFTVSRAAVDLADSNKSVTLSWSSTPAAEVCSASGNAAAAGQNWSGPKSSAGPVTVTYTNVGTYEYTLACYNEFGKSQAITRSVTVTSSTPPPPPPPPDGCQVVKDQIVDPTQRALFQPDGFTRETREWPQVFGSTMVFPNTPGDFYPVGSWTLSGLQYSPAVGTRGKYLSIPITGNGAPLQLQWNSAKPVAAYGYQPARFAEAIYVTITACAGDFRRAGAFQYSSPDQVNDPSFVTQCRSTNTSEAVMSYGPAASGALLCPVESGRRYYINIVFEDVLDGLSPTATSCTTSSTGICEISVKNRPTL